LYISTIQHCGSVKVRVQEYEQQLEKQQSVNCGYHEELIP
jgi:hypothetical protein